MVYRTYRRDVFLQEPIYPFHPFLRFAQCDPLQNIADPVRLYRKLSGMTQEKLAEKAELAPTYISDVERGRENISVDAVARIAKALRVDWKTFFRESKLPNGSRI